MSSRQIRWQAGTGSSEFRPVAWIGWLIGQNDRNFRCKCLARFLMKFDRHHYSPRERDGENLLLYQFNEAAASNGRLMVLPGSSPLSARPRWIIYKFAFFTFCFLSISIFNRPTWFMSRINNRLHEFLRVLIVVRRDCQVNRSTKNRSKISINQAARSSG